MVTGEQHLGNGHATELSWPRVLWPFNEPFFAGKRVVSRAFGIAQHTRHEPAHGVNHRHSRHFAAREHKVTKGNLVGLQDSAYPVIKAFVASAQQHEAVFRRELLDHLLRQGTTTGREHYQMTGSSLPAGHRLFLHAFHTGHHRAGHQEHSRSTTEGPVIHLAMHPFGEVTDIRQPHIEQATTPRSPEQASFKEAGEQLGKQR